MPNRITHFEIHAVDPQRAIAFYSSLFGWSFKKWGDQDYWIITTGPDSEPGINGGLLPRRGEGPLQGQAVNAYVCTASVSSLDASVEKALSLGGTMALPKMPIPTVGWLAYVVDLDGNIFGMIQPDTEAK